jgi:phosphoglycerate dehydrogenase-like enzyme
MSQVNVLITHKIDEEYLHQIKIVSPEIKVWDVSNLVEAEEKGDLTAAKELDALLAETQVIFGFAAPRNVLTRAPNLKWIHTMLAGVERILDADMVRCPVILTNSKGAHDTPCAETALEMMLMLAKNAPIYFQNKQEKSWQRLPGRLLRSKTIGIVGVGSIGTEIARLSKAFHMRVIGIRRSVTQITRARYVDAIYPAKQLNEMLSESDFVVLALPYTPETDKLIGVNELHSMKPTAYLINIGRGRTVDEDALIRALEEYWIAGAGLDAFATEPLPANSKLWELPNVVFSPHVSGDGEDVWMRVTEQFCDNLRRYLSGRRLLNVVHKKRGY